MATKLTLEQQADVEAHAGQATPIRSADGQKVYYLLDETSLCHLQGLAEQQSADSHARLQALIQEGMDALHVPAKEAHARIRRKLAELSQPEA